ncbi:unnamed protein product [Paramecium sonneborni]|uniref:Uncharacterized protein n=1 Tax=Paramecium sonneborni TaxID=65129 RepID=A0A8S1RMP0_9CILI|nr:unnamed protein product [Paramecium sonneborni]
MGKYDYKRRLLKIQFQNLTILIIKITNQFCYNQIKEQDCISLSSTRFQVFCIILFQQKASRTL